ncbi:group 1 glycosyl transferase [Leptolyngbya sp. Heron Island J]|uniref:glycosyltransferase n=1 Tax=Leptolyngbya sp. Heron Island J TaxID=1385935 RepID=UPI0003B999D0|nr:glycosyltransferase [Leptolyngbya sp. Heron Island J]ESA37067.1 group 1 glycosyl transferase [Leptolyngbya sp. Heron Island J]
MPTILIYRDQLLPYSETFIPAQGDSLSHYGPIYVGTSRLTESLQNQQQTCVLEDYAVSGRLWRGLYKFGGISHPRWLKGLKQLKPALVHAHFGSDGGLVFPLCQQLALPLVVTFHGYDATWDTPAWTTVRTQGDFFRALLLHKRDRAMVVAHRLIAVSQFIRDQLLLRGGTADKIVVHYIGIDRQLFCPRVDQIREPIVLFVGRLVEKKGGEYLVRAMAAVQRQLPTVRLVVIGDGPLRSHLQTLADQLAVQGVFLGKQPPEQVRHWMNRAQVFCGPSVIARSGDAEGLGMVFVEAQAMGLPVVSFATGGIPEAVVHGETGLLASEKDTDQLAKNLIRLLEDENLRQRFALAGQAHVAAKFDLKKNTRQLETIYDQVVQQYRG